MHKLMFVATLAPVLAFGAGEYTWVGNASSSWLDASSYTLGGQPVDDPPPAGATVIFQRSSTATINDDSIAYVSSLGRLQIATDTQIGISISTNAVLGCAIAGTSTGTPYGTVVKTGGGRLSLMAVEIVTSSNKYYDYFTAFDVQAGEVAFPQGASGLSGKTEYTGELSVAEDATIRIPDNAATYATAISGAGAIICDATSGRTLRVLGSGTSDFSGKLQGPKLALDAYYGTVNLSGSENEFTGNVALNGASAVLGVGKFGMKSDAASSMGTDSSVEIKASGGMIRYLGTAADATDKEFNFYPGDEAEGSIAGFDAGAFGGVTFLGNWNLYNNQANPARMRWLTLTGSNVVNECVVSNDMPTVSDYTFTVTKRGTGIWRFAGERGLAGAINVDEGTLRFDSIAEQGERSALGTATMLYEEYNGEKDDARKVDYAIRLGNDGTEGAIEYVGAGFAGSKTRPIALKGDGRIVHDGADGFIRLRGISALTSGEKTLTLDGDGTCDCEISGIADGAGRVNVVKEGTGIWAITGTNTFTGSIRVKAGTLCLRNPTNYTWFRWDVMSSQSGGALRIAEMGLFDGGSNRVNGAMNCLTTLATANGNLQYGDAAFEFDPGLHSTSAFKNLFDSSTSDLRLSSKQALRVVQHVGAESDVAFFDFASYKPGSGTAGGPKDFTLQVSQDGGFWTTIFTESVAESDTATRWHYQDASVSDAKHGGRPINTVIPAELRPQNAFGTVSSVRIDAGATLKLEGDVSLGRIVVDSASAGTIAGGSFAEDGVIDVIADPEAAMTELPLTFDGVAGVENVPAWTLKVNGSDSSNHKLKLVNGKLCLKKAGGLILIFR